MVFDHDSRPRVALRRPSIAPGRIYSASVAGFLGAVFPVAFRLTLGRLFPAFLRRLAADSLVGRHLIRLTLTFVSLFAGSLFGIHKHSLLALGPVCDSMRLPTAPTELPFADSTCRKEPIHEPCCRVA
jgi:hypothetical protein